MLPHVLLLVNLSRIARPRLILVALSLAASAAFAAFAAGCSNVAAYQRQRLAHPTMTSSFGQSDALAHVRAVQEGAIGGEMGASSGCGCN
jgi:hypothetical protein